MTARFVGMGRRIARHGTDSGYQSHLAEGSLPCGPCIDAHREKSRLWRQRKAGKGCAPGLGWPLRNPEVTR